MTDKTETKKERADKRIIDAAFHFVKKWRWDKSRPHGHPIMILHEAVESHPDWEKRKQEDDR